MSSFKHIDELQCRNKLFWNCSPGSNTTTYISCLDDYCLLGYPIISQYQVWLMFVTIILVLFFILRQENNEFELKIKTKDQFIAAQRVVFNALVDDLKKCENDRKPESFNELTDLVKSIIADFNRTSKNPIACVIMKGRDGTLNPFYF